jgi:hypothetical protein
MAITSSMDLFNHVRTEYVSRWLARIEEVKQSGAFIGVESPLLGEGRVVVAQPRGGFPFRSDLVARDAEGIPKGVSCIFPHVVIFKPQRFTHDGTMPLVVFPFFWTAAPLRVRGAAAGAVRQELARWAARWFGLTDSSKLEPITEQGVHGVIHRVQYLEGECTTNLVAFEVDLGSAHIEALMTLLDALKAIGATEVLLGDASLAES